VAASNVPGRIAARGDGGANFFDGLIDEVRIYNRALSASEILSVYNTIPADLAPPVISNGQPTGVLPAGTAQITMTVATDENANCRWDATPGMAYASMTAFNTTGGTSHSTPIIGLQDGQSYNFYVKCQDVAGNVNSGDYTISFSIAASSAPMDLALMYPFDDGIGTLVSDYSGNSHTGMLVDNPVWVRGRFGSALSFDGLNDSVQSVDDPLDLTGSLTITAWVFRRSNASVHHIASKNENGRVCPWQLALLTTNRLRSYTSGAAGGQIIDSTDTVSLNAWHHVVLVRDATTAQVTFYVDGVQDSGGWRGYAPGRVAASNVPGRIAARGDGGANFFDGLIDEVRIYNRALSASEISGLYQGGADPSQTGRWSRPLAWPVVGLHLVLLNTGEVLTWDHGVGAHVWNPAAGTFTPVPNSSTDLFCAGHAALSDGRILVIGGDATPTGHLGTADVNIFDPQTKTWTPAAPMAYARWYPTATALPDGRVLATSGAQEFVGGYVIADVPEVYDPVANSWTQLNNAALAVTFYPYMFLLPDGRVVDAGADEGPEVTRVLDIVAQTWTTIDPTIVDGGSAAMYLPGKILKTGSSEANPDASGGAASTNAYVLDMTQPAPLWRTTTPMNFPRVFHTLTLLPDGNVLATSGSRVSTNTDPTLAVYEAELWSPGTEQWSTMSPMQIPRTYHSSALLLPDARVLVAGSGISTGPNQLNAQIFSPPYLFKGPRPVIAAAPNSIQYGTTFTVDTPDAANIQSVALIRPGAMTHTFDEEQRYLSLDLQLVGNGIQIQAPANANLAPPGYYMLFIVNTSGVPSVASFVRIE
jgi:hypothetical protein